jgi:hypothetical protein
MNGLPELEPLPKNDPDVMSEISLNRRNDARPKFFANAQLATVPGGESPDTSWRGLPRPRGPSR